MILDSKALTRIQAIIVAVIVVFAAAAGGLAHVLWSGNQQAIDTVKIGILADLKGVSGRHLLQGAVLAAEQVNAEGGVLGERFEIVSADDDSESWPLDVSVGVNALTRLITVDKADYVISYGGIDPFVYQDICADHKVLYFTSALNDELTQRVADDYDRYKGFFRSGTGNTSSAINGITDSILTLRNYTGFNEVALLVQDVQIFHVMASGVADALEADGVNVVLQTTMALTSLDFSSYYAKAEESGAEILVPFIGGEPTIPFVKEYADRQSPLVVWGVIPSASSQGFWESTDGKCEFVSFSGYPVISGYPLTNKTISTREAYIERWNEVPAQDGASAYDLVKFILPDALKRAGTFEFEAVIAALEQTDVETSLARHFVYTSAHDIMIGPAGPNRPGEDYLLVCMFQWQDGKQVPVYPIEVKQEAEATYKFPPWYGPWD